MARFVKLTNASSGEAFIVNIELAMWVGPGASGGSTIAFQGGDDDVVRVRESPEKVLYGLTIYKAGT